MGEIITIIVPWRNNIKSPLLNSLEILAEIAVGSAWWNTGTQYSSNGLTQVQ